MEAEVRITLNGEPRAARHGMSIAGLLGELGVDRGKVVVEHNRRIVSREDFDGTILQEGDALEILALVSGG